MVVLKIKQVHNKNKKKFRKKINKHLNQILLIWQSMQRIINNKSGTLVKTVKRM